MSTFKKKKLRDTLGGKCKGEEEADRDHGWYRFRIGGTVYARTKVSHGRGDVDGYIAGRIARQVGLSKKELSSLVECTMDAEVFYARLEAQGILTGKVGL